MRSILILLICLIASPVFAQGSTGGNGSHGGTYASVPVSTVSFAHPLQSLRAKLKARRASHQAASQASSTCIDGSCGCAGKCGGNCDCASCNCPANTASTPVANTAAPMVPAEGIMTCARCGKACRCPYCNKFSLASTAPVNDAAPPKDARADETKDAAVPGDTFNPNNPNGGINVRPGERLLNHQAPPKGEDE